MSTELIGLPDGCSATEVGFAMPDGLSQDDWIAAGRQLAKCGAALQWWVGDWLNYGERKYGEIKNIVGSIEGFEYETCRKWQWIAREYELCNRLHNVSWTHHHAAASHPDKRARKRLLALGADGKPKLTVREIKDAVREFKERHDGYNGAESDPFGPTLMRFQLAIRKGIDKVLDDCRDEYIPAIASHLRQIADEIEGGANGDD